MRAPLEQLPFVALNFRAWARNVLRENADSVGVTELAEKMAAEMRAGL
jgi:hypothetical protein